MTERKRTHLTHDQYKQYLKSEAWAKKRHERLQIDGYRCAGCGTKLTDETAAVHHLNYYAIGDENVWSDLVTLCSACHRKIHAVLCRPTAQLADGTIRHGWKDSLPDFIKADLRQRGVIDEE